MGSEATLHVDPLDPSAAGAAEGPEVSDRSGSDVGGRRLPSSIAFGLGFATWGAVLGAASLRDNSLFTHLATGRIIFDTHRVPTVDPYSFTANGDPWVVQSWLASILYAGAEELGGFGALRLLNAVLAAVGMACIWALSRRAETAAGRVVVTASAAVVATMSWTHRPLLFGMVGLLLVLLALEGRLDPRWLVPVMWLWVNTHGSFPYAVLVVVLVALGTRLDGERPTAELRVLGWTLAGIALSVVNPMGPRLLLFPLSVMEKTDAFRNIVEWQAPKFDNVGSLLFLAQLMLAVALLVRAPRWRAAIPLVVFMALALTSSRNIGQTSLIVVPGIAAGMGTFRLGSIDVERRTQGGMVAAVVATVLLLLAPLAVLQSKPDLELDTYPVDALEWADEQDLWSAGRVAHPDFVGNLLTARYGPEGRVFFDDRVDMYPVAMTDDYVKLTFGLPGWRTVLDRWEIESVVWERDQPLVQLLAEREDWQRAYADDDWVVYRRSGG